MNRGAKVKPDPRRGLPAVDRLVAEIAQLEPDLPNWAALAGSRRVLKQARERFASGDSEPSQVAPLAELAAQALVIGKRLSGGHPRRVVNATGIPLHTNLGRAPLAPGAAAAVAAAAQTYSNLELDLSTGRRGNRLEPVCAKLELLTGAEAALVVNNNAAALLLALDTFARDMSRGMSRGMSKDKAKDKSTDKSTDNTRRKQVIVSRGELVEIGGSFRVPDIMERAGVELVEVGTTNRTHPADYANAIGPDTALLLKVHRSNFELSGYVAEASLTQLAEIGAAHGVPVVEDLGSGTLIDLSSRGFPAEIYAPARLGLGADVVCFSGDKLLGGPQAGILLGSHKEIDAMRRNPLARALRLDKLSLAALDWTLEAYLDGRAEQEIPVLRQLLTPLGELEKRARALADRLAKQPDVADRSVAAVRDRSFVGGGSLPGFELDSWVVTVRSSNHPDRVAEALRDGPRPVLARVRDGVVVLDVRTLLAGDEDIIVAAFANARAAQ